MSYDQKDYMREEPLLACLKTDNRDTVAVCIVIRDG